MSGCGMRLARFCRRKSKGERHEVDEKKADRAQESEERAHVLCRVHLRPPVGPVRRAEGNGRGSGRYRPGYD